LSRVHKRNDFLFSFAVYYPSGKRSIIIPWASNQYYYLFPAAKENKKPQKSIYFVTVLAAFRLQGASYREQEQRQNKSSFCFISPLTKKPASGARARSFY